MIKLGKKEKLLLENSYKNIKETKMELHYAIDAKTVMCFAYQIVVLAWKAEYEAFVMMVIYVILCVLFIAILDNSLNS